MVITNLLNLYIFHEFKMDFIDTINSLVKVLSRQWAVLGR